MSGRPAIRTVDYLAPAFGFSVLVNLLMLTGPLFMLQVYDRVLSSRSEETLVALLGLVLGLYGFMWILDFSRARVLARYGAQLQNRLDVVAMRRTFTARKSGEPSCTPRDLEVFQAFSGSSAMTALLDLPFAPAFVFVIFLLHPWLGWLAVAGGLILIVTTALNEWLTAKRRLSVEALGADARHYASALAHEAEAIKAQAMTDAVLDRWSRFRNSALRESLSAEDLTGLLSSLIKAARLALQSMILALGAWLVLAAEITPGAMIAASILLGRGLAPIEQILSRWPQIRRAVSAWRNIQRVQPDETEKAAPTRLPTPKGHLSLAGVTLTGGPGTPARLYNVSFTLQPGEALAIVGKSGAGKSTLARVIVGLLRPTVGEVRLAGALPEQYGASLGTHIGYLPQLAALLPGTIAENIGRMSPDASSERIVNAARAAGAHDLILSLPAGYDTMLDQETTPLSGGQVQRIAFARALFGDPAFLVLDEPNSWLDGEGTHAMNTAIRTAKSRGSSVVIMTHRPQAISECDRLLVLDKGKVLALGPRDEVLKALMRDSGSVLFETTRKVPA